jgi:hypothetical protein
MTERPPLVGDVSATRLMNIIVPLNMKTMDPRNAKNMQINKFRKFLWNTRSSGMTNFCEITFTRERCSYC